MAGRPPQTQSPPRTAGGARSPAEGPELTRDREVGGSALRCDQSPQPPARIGPGRPGVPGRPSFRPQVQRGAGVPRQVPPAGGGAQPCRARGAAGPRIWQPLPAAGEPPPPQPRRSLEPLGSPVTSLPDYALTRFQPHFLAGVGNVRAGGGGASVGVRRSRESTLDPALPPPLGRARPITHIGPTQTGPLPPPARPPPGAAVPALCSRPPRVAGRRAGRGRARAGRGGGEEGRGWCCPRSRPRPAPAPPALPPPPRSCVPSCPVQSLARPGP